MTDPAAIDLDEIKVRRHPSCHTNSIVLDDDFNSLIAAVEVLRKRVVELEPGKRAPVQGYSAGIPWSMHLRAYDMYCKKYCSQPALIDLEKQNCRGGFGTEELDEVIPGWRDELSEIGKLLRRAEASEAHAVELATALEATISALKYYLPATKIGSIALATLPAQSLARHKALENCAVVLRCYAKNKIGDAITDALAKLDTLTQEDGA